MKRLFKREARKAYVQGTTVNVVPCRMLPRNTWGMSVDISSKDLDADVSKEKHFDDTVQEFTWYNCNYEVGYYPAFYVD